MELDYKEVDTEEDVREQLRTLNHNLNFVTGRVNDIYLMERRRDDVREKRKDKAMVVLAFFLIACLAGIAFLVLVGAAYLLGGIS